jgi:membrane protein implicated in regulation of membrane protease activity
MLKSWGLEISHLWLIAACVIAIVELMLVGSYYLLAVAAGAAIVGIVTMSMNLSTTAQWLTFALATAVAATQMRYLRSPTKNNPPDDVSHMVGSLVSVVEAVAPRGRVAYKSVTWAAEYKNSQDTLEAGASARIVRVHGSTLYIEKTEEKI